MDDLEQNSSRSSVRISGIKEAASDSPGSMYSENCLKRPFKNDKTKVLTPCGSSMQVESIAEHSAMLLACIKR